MSKKISYPTIPDDVLIDIKISGAFYKDLSSLMVSLSESVTPAQYKATIEKISSDKPAESVFELTVEVVMALIIDIENKAKEQGKTKIIEVDPDNSIAN
jgi:hypothetical protein